MNIVKAAIENNYNLVLNFLYSGTDPDYCEDQTNITALHVCALNRNYWIAKLLLDFGANSLTQEKILFKTPLDIAIDFGHEEIAKLLQNHTNSFH